MNEQLHPVQVERFRRMTPPQKLQMVADLYHARVRQKAAGLRMAHPDWPEERLDREARGRCCMPAPSPLALFLEPLERLGLPYCVTGSVPASEYGEPRLTADIDISRPSTCPRQLRREKGVAATSVQSHPRSPSSVIL